MDPIGSFSGLASGMQWRDMVDQMMRVEISRRMTPVQTQVTAAGKRRDAWNSFSGLLSKYNDAAKSLRDGSAFSALQTKVGLSAAGKTLLSATASATAAPGTYQVEVLNLAKADKLSGAAVLSTSETLGLAGDFFVNGKRVELVASDTLTTARDKINALNSGSTPSGVTATILSTATDEHRLVLTSDATGSRGIELADGGAGILTSLGITTGTLVQNTKPGDAASTQTQRFASSTNALAAMLGVTAPPAVTTIEIDGRKITVDLATDTLLSIRNRIIAAGGTASIEQETVGGKTLERLTVGGIVTADAAATAPAASQRVVELLGFQTGQRASSITTGEDASIKIDGFAVTRRLNVVSDAIAGISLNLQHAEPGSPVEVAVTRDLDAVVKAAESLAAAYNELVSFAEKQRAPGAPLAASGSLNTTMSALSRTLLNGVEGLTATNPYTHVSLVGIELTKDGRLEVDAVKLKSVLETNLSDVQALLSTSGSTTDGEVTYIGATSSSKAGAYAVDITAPATRATDIGTAWADPNSYAASDGISDTLTLTDSVSGKSVDYVLAQGKSLSAAVTELNELFALEKVKLTASGEGGALRITSQDYGSASTFSVSGTAAAPLGLTTGTHAGTDVAGTIGGLAATGVGRVLTGAAGGATEGIAIRYTGDGARAAGEVRYIRGFGGMVDDLIQPIVRTTDGAIARQVSSLDRSIESLNLRLDDIEARVEIRREALIQQFTRMEALMSRLQSQGNWLASQIQSLQPRQNS